MSFRTDHRLRIHNRYLWRRRLKMLMFGGSGKVRRTHSMSLYEQYRDIIFNITQYNELYRLDIESRHLGFFADLLEEYPGLAINEIHVCGGTEYEFNFEILHRILVAAPRCSSLSLERASLKDLDVTILINIVANFQLTRLGLKYIKFLVPDMIVRLGEELEKNPRLQHLDTFYVDFGAERGSILASIIRYNSTLTTVKYSNNKLNDVDVSIIGEALMENTTLTTLDLESNMITDIRPIVRGLMHNQESSLTTLKMSCNRIDDESVKFISMAIANGLKIDTLDLSYNTSITTEGLGYLIELLGSRKGDLKKLSLTSKGIDNIIFEKLTEALKTNSKISALSLKFDNSQIDNEHMEKFIEMLESGGGSSLVNLLYIYGFPRELIERLGDVLKRNEHNARLKSDALFVDLMFSLRKQLKTF